MDLVVRLAPGLVPGVRVQAQAGEHLRHPGQQDPPDQGGVQQGQGAHADLRGGRGDDEVRGRLRVHHHALRHGEVSALLSKV